jgi:nickel/cobalt exporter
MTWVNAIMQPGSASSLFYIPTAIVLGALHGLEPGHSKTMMAAFIIAVRGTIAQAVLLGLAATISHTAVVWLVAFGGMYFFNGVNAEASEPYFQVVSAVLIIAIAVWMLTRTWREQQALKAEKAALAAALAPTMRRIDTGHGHIGLELQPDDGVGTARFHVHRLSGHGWAPEDVGLTLTRPTGARENFTLSRARTPRSPRARTPRSPRAMGGLSPMLQWRPRMCLPSPSPFAMVITGMITMWPSPARNKP